MYFEELPIDIKMFLYFSEGLPARMMFDRTVCAKQLSVVEAHGLLLFRTDKGKKTFMIYY